MRDFRAIPVDGLAFIISIVANRIDSVDHLLVGVLP